jgi:hypothetical protein
MSDCVVCDFTTCVLEYCCVVCLVVSGAAHVKLCGVDLWYNSVEPLQAVIHCEHTCDYFFVLKVIIFCGGIIYPLT